MSIQSAHPRRHRVVVIGSGFGGLFSTQALKRADVDVTLIARTTHHLFQPLLYQVATGILSVGDIAPATRLVLRKQKNAQVLLGEVEKIDLTAKTVTSRLLDRDTVTEFDSLIVAAGAGQSYFGNDHFAKFAPGMKTIDDALELRGRILGAFEEAELSNDPEERARLLTFVVVGAGPTGVELAGQIAELANRTLEGAFRHIDPRDARVILLDGAPVVLPVYGGKLSANAAKRLEKLGVEIQPDAMVTDVDVDGLTVKDKDGTERRVDCQCKVWSAGVQASGLGKQLAEQSGAEIDRAGRVHVNPDLSLPGHPNVYVIGDMMALDSLPGLAQVAMQGGKHAAKQVKATLAGTPPEERTPFKYFDKGSMATISRFSAVAKVGKLEITGFIGWLMWLVIHLMYLVGFRSKFSTVLSWTVAFLGRSRAQMASTEQQVFARTAIEDLQDYERARAAGLIGDPTAVATGEEREAG
ncbi:NADH dehydrogenase [Rhodococcus sp. RD6.2]|jgi:NADH dehydrogenase|uniref:NAD(P)/FAD-dependent oxidoreductase n=1 Tax=unclassified Rhodococcus (in: high G+C Gram-positive bacteria) TaxID=192944 RepID=UPI00063B6F79|nr:MULTISPECIES: NAD(P)/FAD-dependent oxidoreductase [unclassified Rhodococcus (in: high G+C Gram-positive bacteria)]CRK51271.1 NADH dehydrogenase [Rhodococcus sp. RD6.2]